MSEVSAGVTGDPERRYDSPSPGRDLDASESDRALLRRAFGPQPAVLADFEEQELAQVLRRRATSGLSSARALGAAAPPGDPANTTVDEPSSESALVGSGEGVKALTEAAFASRTLIRQRCRAVLVGCAVAAGVLAVCGAIWLTVQPRPTAVLHSESMTAEQLEDALGTEPNFFGGYSATNGVSYGELYGVRIVGTTLTNVDESGALECLWFLPPEEYALPFCSTARDRSDYPRLLDLWRHDDALIWTPVPSRELHQIRIAVQGDRLEVWEELVSSSP